MLMLNFLHFLETCENTIATSENHGRNFWKLILLSGDFRDFRADMRVWPKIGPTPRDGNESGQARAEQIHTQPETPCAHARPTPVKSIGQNPVTVPMPVKHRHAQWVPTVPVSRCLMSTAATHERTLLQPPSHFLLASPSPRRGPDPSGEHRIHALPPRGEPRIRAAATRAPPQW